MKPLIFVLLILVSLGNAQQELYPKKYVSVSDSVITVSISHESDFIGIVVHRFDFLLTVPFLDDWMFVSGKDTLFKGYSEKTKSFAIAMIVSRQQKIAPEEYIKIEYADFIKEGWIIKSDYNGGKLIKSHNSIKEIVQQIICVFPYSDEQFIVLKVFAENEEIYEYGPFTEVYFNGFKNLK